MKPAAQPRLSLFALLAGVSLLFAACPAPDDPPDPTPTPAPLEGYLVASTEGVIHVAPDGSLTELTNTPAASAYATGAGVVLQELPEDPFQPAPIALLEGVPVHTRERILEPGPQHRHLMLHGVAQLDGRDHAVVTEVTGHEPDDQVERLVTIDLESGEREDVAVTGSWEEWTSRVTFGDGVFAVYSLAEVTTYTRYLTPDGRVTSVTHDPLPEPCGDDITCPAGVVTDPDGTLFAWLQGAEGPDGTFVNQLVVIDRGDGSQVLVEELPDGTGLAQLELGSGEVIVNLWNLASMHSVPLVPPMIFDLETGEEREPLEPAGYATAVR